MATVILNQELADDLIAKRRELGQDRLDEVWEGTYIMAAAPNDEHSGIASDLCALFKLAIEWQGLGRCREGVNVSDRVENWTENYRIPDVCVFLSDGNAEEHNTFWFGGPDFAVEIASPAEDPHKKIAFYASVGVRELLIIERKPWKLELHRLTEGRLKLEAEIEVGDHDEIISKVIPFGFKLEKGENRPGIAVRNTISGEMRRI